MKKYLEPYLQVFKSRRIAIISLMGFASGLPLALSGGTLQAWMTVEGIDLKTIGIFALVGLPYTLKFLWSPFMDRFIPPYFGRRRGWIVITQILLVLAIALLSFTSPSDAVMTVGFLALFIAFISASQDIVIDAYRTDVLHEKERGVGAAVFVMGYRIATLVSGAFALIMSDHIGWRNTYLVMAVIMFSGILTTLFAKEPDKKVTPPANMKEAVWGPLQDYFKRESAIILLLLIVLYKLGDAFAGTLTTPFLIRGIGFTPSDVGTINKGLGFLSLIIGATIGGTLMIKLGLYRALLFFGILQAVSNLSFMVLAWIGKSYGMLIFTIAFENFSGGMGTSAFVSLIMGMCNHRFTATQYALLSSLAALGRIFIAPSSGFLVESIGWPGFFFITFIFSIPGLLLLLRVKFSILNIEKIKVS